VKLWLLPCCCPGFCCGGWSASCVCCGGWSASCVCCGGCGCLGACGLYTESWAARARGVCPWPALLSPAVELADESWAARKPSRGLDPFSLPFPCPCFPPCTESRHRRTDRRLLPPPPPLSSTPLTLPSLLLPLPTSSLTLTPLLPSPAPGPSACSPSLPPSPEGAGPSPHSSPHASATPCPSLPCPCFAFCCLLGFGGLCFLAPSLSTGDESGTEEDPTGALPLVPWRQP